VEQYLEQAGTPAAPRRSIDVTTFIVGDDSALSASVTGIALAGCDGPEPLWTRIEEISMNQFVRLIHRTPCAIWISLLVITGTSCMEIDGDLSTSQTEQLVCSGTGCQGKDPKTEGCDVNTTDGKSARTSWGIFGQHYVSVVVRKSTSCGGVKWPKAQTDEVCGVFSTWLTDSNKNELFGTRYSDSTPSHTQIYGDMWTGAVRACASVCGREACTDLDN
jgi:hypothetical protein